MTGTWGGSTWDSVSWDGEPAVAVAITVAALVSTGRRLGPDPGQGVSATGGDGPASTGRRFGPDPGHAVSATAAGRGGLTSTGARLGADPGWSYGKRH